jgi:hypothetical protein
MNYCFMPSIDVQFTKTPAIAIAGPSGCGKTESAMRMARGYCGAGVPFAVIDTEEKRALYKKPRYQPWDWLDFQPPFTPENCVEALKSAIGYKAVILDSGSAEYDGDGGICDIQEETLERMCKGDVKRMEALSGPAWKTAKLRHKRVFMNYLRRYPTLLIICLRAEPKVRFVKIEGKTQIVDAGYQPICEKQFMYDMLVACKMTPGEAGIPEHIKKLERELEPIFLDGKQIDEHTGERLAVWTQLRAASGAKQSSPPPVQQLLTDGVSLPSLSGAGGGAGPESAATQVAQKRDNVGNSAPPAVAAVSKAAAQGNGSTGGDAGPESPPASAAAPVPDATIVADVDKFISKRKYQSAADVASMILDDALRGATLERIAAAYKRVAK